MLYSSCLTLIFSLDTLPIDKRDTQGRDGDRLILDGISGYHALVQFPASTTDDNCDIATHRLPIAQARSHDIVSSCSS
jgi:hypothetical protein